MTQHDCAAVESYDPASSTWRYVLGGLPPTSVDYDVYTFRYPSFQHIKQSAADLARAIQAQLSGRDVIMIAHSMGGLVAASYMNTDPAEHVQHLITLGTPWNGSVLANNISVSVTAAHNCVFEDSYYSESEKNLAALAAVYDWAKATSDGSDDLAPSSIFFKSLTPSAIQSLSSRITAITGDVRTSFRSPPIVAHAFSVTMPCTLKRLGAQSGGDAIVPTESSNNGGLLSVSSSLGFDHALLTDDFVDQGNPTPFDPLPKVVKKLSSLRLDVMPVSTVQAHVSKSNLSIGETATLSANLLDYQGRAVTPRAISWSVSPPGVVTLNGAQGTLTAITGGSATITAAVNSYKGGGGTTKAHQLTISVSEGTPKLVLGQAALSSSITTGQSAPLQVVNVTNGGSGTLSGLSIGTITYGQNQQAGWFSAALTSTTAPTTISVTYATTTLPAGTYTASVPVLSSTSGVQNSPALISITLTVGQASGARLALSSTSATFAHTIGASTPSAQTIQISNAGSGALSGLSAATSYQAGQQSGWLTASLSQTSAPAALALAVTPTSLPTGAYRATVVISGSAGTAGSPQSVIVDLNVTSGQAVLTSARSGNGAGTVSSTPAGIACSFATDGTASGSCAASFAIGTTITLAATPAIGSTFGGWSGGCSGAGGCSLTLSQPLTITAAFNTASTVTISTSANPSNGGSTTSPGTVQQGSSVTVSATPASNYQFTGWTEGATSVSPNASYTFTATASRALVANFGPTISAPAAPSGVAASANASYVAVAWNDNSSNESGFQIERATGSGAYAVVGTTLQDIALFLDQSVTHGTTYSYRVKSFNSAGYSQPSASATVTVPTVSAPSIQSFNWFSTPTEGIPFGGQVTGTGLNVSGLQVYFCISGSTTCYLHPSAGVAVLNSSSLNLSSVQLGAGSYQLYLTSAAGNSLRSTSFAVQAVAKPNTPTGTSLGSLTSPGPVTSSTQVTASWNATTGAIYYSFAIRNMSSGRLDVDITTSNLSFSVNLTAGLPYRWNVAACNASGCSLYSSLLYFQTPGAPAIPANTAPGSLSSPGPTLSSRTVTLKWNAVAGATSYGVGVRDMSTNALVVSTTVQSAQHTVTLTAGRPYRWDVAACNSSGCSNYTTPLYFKTP